MTQGSAERSGGREVLLTGATGFVGKVVLEALLRRREALGIERVHVLIRPGGGGSSQQRFAREVEPSPCFARLPAGWSERVEVLEGDVTLPSAGLAPEVRARLAKRLTHVLHAAASVEFELPLAEACSVNVGGCLELLALAREIPQLERMVAVSTAYVTPWPGEDVAVREKLAPLPRPAREIHEEILAGAASEPALLRETGHPNTYTFTKCLAEHLLAERRGAVPLAIVRPSIVSASWREPVPGWIDSGAAFAAFVVATGTGYLRALVAGPDSRLDIVPVDVVAARVLAAGFGAQAPAAPGEPAILHAVAGLARSPTVDECRRWLVDFFRGRPVDRRPGVPYLGAPGLRFALAHLRHHEVPLRVASLVSARARRAGPRLRARLAQLNRTFPYFTRSTFDFRSDLEADDLPPDPREYIETVCHGVYRHLLRRDDREVPLAGRRGPDRGGSLRFALRQPHGSPAIRATGWLVDRVLRRCADQVTFDLASFERARDALPEGAALVLAPSHRSYLDFVLCSYLAFARPDLGIPIPHIAAAVEFSRIPILGRLFGSLHTFYLERGIGREDKALTSQVHELIRRGDTLEFFVEGARSRARQFLPPKRGFLRSLQATGATVALLPVAFSYDRVPEEASFVRELAGEEKAPMRLRALLGWSWRMLRGRVQLGRVHLACGSPVLLDLDRDVHAVGREVVAELQDATVATTFHLRAFGARAGLRGAEVRALAEALRARGGRVLESSLEGAESLPPQVEASLRWQFLHRFYPEARRALGHHPLVAQHLERNDFAGRSPAAAPPDDAQGELLLRALFEPICRDAVATLDALGTPDAPLAFASPRSLVRVDPERHLPHVEAVFDDLVRRGVLERRGELHGWGPRAEDLAHCRTLYAWPERPANPDADEAAAR